MVASFAGFTSEPITPGDGVVTSAWGFGVRVRVSTGARLAGMLGGLALILAFQLVGEVFVRVTGLPIPGPSSGWCCSSGLRWHKPREGSNSVHAADVLVRYLPIMFVPTTVGVIVYGPMIASQWRRRWRPSARGW